MTVVTNTFETYQTKGIRESLSDIIYNIAPEETPFVSNAGRGEGADSTYFEWQTDDLASPDATNAQIEGDDVSSFQAAAPTVRIGNYQQISRKTVVISGTNEKVKKAGRKSELSYQLSKRGKELKRDIETICLANQGAFAGASNSARKTGSVLAFIKTNTDKGTGGADPSYTSVPTATRTDGTQRTFTETMLKTVIQKCWTAGASPDTVMVGAAQKQLISQSFAGIATKTMEQTAAKAAIIVGAADVYVSDFGTLKVIPNRFQRNRDAFVLDFDMVELSYLRDITTEELAKTGDAEKRMLLGEWGLKVKNEAGLGLAADLS